MHYIMIYNKGKTMLRNKHLKKENIKIFNPLIEIEATGLSKILDFNGMIDVYYFESTEHQNYYPRRCKFGEYMIDFAPNGTDWCGGMRGNGYVFKRDINGNYNQVTTISPQLSDYLAQVVIEKKQMSR